MDESYRPFFGLQREPFSADISLKDVLVTPTINAVSDRIHYTIRLGAANHRGNRQRQINRLTLCNRQTASGRVSNTVCHSHIRLHS